ncbi:MAG: phosphate ABC transporter substrate-binding protein PstS [Acidobacteria bacterium]|nr:phosphate ABC transporter substrate-binding protein PstS [Acidobacteriota bacterium]MBI3655012.1 phosphate ABC transporter substrate-binding protein PstS [Acidobacteriota bacterium]
MIKKQKAVSAIQWARCLALTVGVVLLISSLGCSRDRQATISLQGAGATFPYPLYSKWMSEYQRLKPNVRIDYQSIGSGAGIRQIRERVVDFGASDAPMTDQDLNAAPGKILHIPTVIGAVVVTYNLPSVNGELKLERATLAGIFLGEITKWNDAKLRAINSTLALPDTAIVVVHRTDGSGTTNIFTDFLSRSSPLWQQRAGKGTSVNWPVGIGGKGNEGVTGQVKQLPGAIGYVELAYAEQNKLPYALIENPAGEFIKPSIGSTTAAAAGIISAMPEDFRVSLVNAPGRGAYPIAGFTYILIYQNQAHTAKGRALVEFLQWAIREGQEYASAILYAPLPIELVPRVYNKLRTITY